MANRPFRLLRIVFVVAFLIALAACGGTKTTVCPAASSCGCGIGTALCVAPQYVYANGIDGQVSVFPVDPATGTLGSPTAAAGPAMSLGMAAMNNQFLYVSGLSANLTQPAPIDAWSIDLGRGSLATVAGSPFPLMPPSIAAGLAVDNNSQTLYVADGGRIDALKSDSTGALATVPGSPFLAGDNLYLTVDPQDRFLFATDNTVPGSVEAFTIDSSTGALTAVSGSPFAIGPVGSSLLLGIVVDTSSRFVYTAMQTTGQVAGFSIAAPSGALTPIPGSPFTTGSTPIALSTANNFLYVSNLGDGTLSGFAIDPATGVLTPLAGSPFAILAGSLTTDTGGNYLYTAGSGGMMTLKIDRASGVPAQVGSTIPYKGATVLTFVQ
jgi:6-phosphogluconolactonase